MSNYEKGKRSQEEIISSCRQIFNEHGIQITLTTLAELMNTTLGRLTHHFRNKDLLFIAIAQDYENKLKELRQNRPSGSLLTLDTFIKASSQVMDLQYEYRCVIRYAVASLQHQKEMKSHILETYSNSRTVINNTIKAYIDSGSLQPKLLQNDIFEVFLFQLTNLFTNWVVNLELYDINRSYHEMKPIYMKGIISIFLPYLTQKGIDELNQNGLFGSSVQYSNRF
jgi:AcrR family transcriptional regulator